MNSTFAQKAQWIMQSCETLGAMSQSPDYVDRRYLTPEHKAANALVSEWMTQAGMSTWQDGVGNIWGRYESELAEAKSLLFGSHLDTVVNGGKYDGMLGVICPIALVSLLNEENTKLPYHIDIVGFCDEEGTRFDSTLLGSRALTGKWQAQWADIKDADGITLRQAMLNFGLDFDKVNSCKLAEDALLAYLEVHIEQGPVLEAENLPVGTVTAIAGARRLIIQVKGMAGHAGTVPMNTRQDALAGASEMILAIESHANKANVVATVGRINCKPNAVNVIPGFAEFSLDIRSECDSTRDEILSEIEQNMEEIASKRLLALNIKEIHQAPAVQCASALTKQLLSATQRAGIKPFQLFSGAGHDAMAMADICPVGMLFTRCEKGISHHPAEAITTDDVASTLSVLYAFIEDFNVGDL